MTSGRAERLVPTRCPPEPGKGAPPGPRNGNYRHGMGGCGSRKPAEWKAWWNALQRCTNPNDPNWDNYGGRGIRMCEEWRESFAAFYEHIGPKPHPRLTLERVDNDRGYEPGNVRWATRSEQSRNQRARTH